MNIAREALLRGEHSIKHHARLWTCIFLDNMPRCVYRIDSKTIEIRHIPAGQGRDIVHECRKSTTPR